MGDIIVYPMTYAHYARGERSLTLIWADSSKLIMDMMGDIPYSWMRTDAELACTRLESAGWKQTGKGQVV